MMPLGETYKKVENALEPAHELVTILLIFIIVVSALMLFASSNSARTAWVTYMLMP